VKADQGLRRTVAMVAFLNLLYFGIEFVVARTIGSVSLFANSIDFLEDASVNLLILFALAWNARKCAIVGMALAAILMVPAVATLWTAWSKFGHPFAPEPIALTLAGLGALTMNLLCACGCSWSSQRILIGGQSRRRGGSLASNSRDDCCHGQNSCR